MSRHLFEKCIKGFLSDKLRILVTHQFQNYISQADYVIVLKEGQIFAQGTYEELVAAQVDFISLVVSEEAEANSRKASLINSGDHTPVTAITSTPATFELSEKEQKMTKEAQAEGSVGLKTYVAYCKMGRAPFLLTCNIIILCLCQVGISASDYFLSFWTNAERDLLENKENSSYLGRNTYIYIYSGLIGIAVVLSCFRSVLFFKYSSRIAVNMHESMFMSLIRAPSRFFDVNASGRIMNRFTKDMGATDESLPHTLLDVLLIFSQMLGILSVIVISNYYLAPVAVIVLAVLCYIRSYYVCTARAVKRIEGISKNP